VQFLLNQSAYNDFANILTNFARILSDFARIFTNQKFWGYGCCPASYTGEAINAKAAVVSKKVTRRWFHLHT